MRSKVQWGKVLGGAVLAGVGAILVSPADEIVVTAATGGVGAIAAPIQGPVTAVAGAALITAGVGIMISGVGGAK